MDWITKPSGNGGIADSVMNLELQIEGQLALIRQMMVTVESQLLEVAEKFLCDALGLARAGKGDLAQRKLAAALNVLAGGKKSG